MNDVIRYVVSDFLDFNDLLNLSLTCKHLYKLLKSVVKKKKIQKIEQIESMFNFSIIDIVNKENFLKAKWIDWNRRWENNEYEIYVENFEGNMVYTKDTYNRSFLFVKVEVESPTIDILPYKNTTVMVIFQKYSDISVYFVSDYNNYCISTNYGGIFIEIEYYKHFKNFFKTGQFDYSEFPYDFPFPPLYEKVKLIKN